MNVSTEGFCFKTGFYCLKESLETTLRFSKQNNELALSVPCALAFYNRTVIFLSMKQDFMKAGPSGQALQTVPNAGLDSTG